MKILIGFLLLLLPVSTNAQEHYRRFAELTTCRIFSVCDADGKCEREPDDSTIKLFISTGNSPNGRVRMYWIQDSGPRQNRINPHMFVPAYEFEDRAQTNSGLGVFYSGSSRIQIKRDPNVHDIIGYIITYSKLEKRGGRAFDRYVDDYSLHILCSR